jgi:hypothetical protein
MSEIRVDTLTGKTTANDITVTVGATATMSLEQGLAKAWSHYDTYTTTASTPTDGFNVSSLTDNAAADTTNTFTNAMSNATFVISGSAAYGRGDPNATGRYMAPHPTLAYATTHARVISNYDLNLEQDVDYVNVIIHGDLA